MHVVLEGEIAVLSDGEQLVTVHQPGQFSGDVDLLSGRPVVVSGRARGDTRVLEVRPERLRSIVQTDPELSEIFLRAFILRRLAIVAHGAGNVLLIGSRHSAGTLELQEFLTRNSQPYAYMDVDRDEGVQETLESFGVRIDDVPVFICRGKRVLKKPTIEEVGECLGMNVLTGGEDKVRDLVVIGAGPAGLAAAVYAASEGIDALVIESNAPGGQAGSSSRIENYLGFPTGITGQDLAGRALVQAEKFGAELAVARTALHLGCGSRPYRVELGGGASVQARAVAIATGARYRKPDLPNLARFEGVGVYYGATQIEANLCRGEEVVIVGGGNSAGQAAVFLLAERGASAPAREGGGARGVDVAVPHPANRTNAEHRAQDADRDRGARGQRLARKSRVARQFDGRNDHAADPPRLSHDRRQPEHGVAREVRRPRREGVHQDGPRSLSRRSRRFEVAPRAPAASLRDQHSRRVRDRGRPGRKREARRRRRRRGLRRRPARPQGPRGVVP